MQTHQEQVLPRPLSGRGETPWAGFGNWQQLALLAVLVALLIIGSMLSPNFLEARNLLNVTRQMAFVGIVAVAATVVILTAGIDLSIGAVVGLAAVAIGQAVQAGMDPVAAFAFGIVVGGAVGALNGLAVTLGRLPPFIATLGALVMIRGYALMLSDGRTIRLEDRAAEAAWLGSGEVLGMGVPVFVFVGIALATAAVLNGTKYGRYVRVIGDSREAARAAGLPIRRVEWSVYVYSGLLAGLTAAIFVSRLGVAEPTAGTGLELDAIAVVVIGGTSLFGGRGGVAGTILGVAALAVLQNILNLTGVSPFAQQVVQGAVVVIAVLVERLVNRSRE